MKFLVGVDEVGRGPIAGPVTVCAVAVPHDFSWHLIPGVNDSKKMSEKARKKVYGRAQELSITSSVMHIDARSIDEKGIVPSITKALEQSLDALAIDPLQCVVLLDGGLRAPEKYLSQKTIIKGDATEKIIGLASILAKVERDTLMSEYALLFPNYGFERNKGYGTAAHYEALERFGLTQLHRRSFIGSREYLAALQRG